MERREGREKEKKKGGKTKKNCTLNDFLGKKILLLQNFFLPLR
jgi:hypothetical protein